MGEEGLEQSRQLHLSLQGTLQWQPFQLDFQLLINGELIKINRLNEKDIEQRQVEKPRGEHSNSVLLAWHGMAWHGRAWSKIIKKCQDGQSPLCGREFSGIQLVVFY
jgi:hypothetical protein